MDGEMRGQTLLQTHVAPRQLPVIVPAAEEVWPEIINDSLWVPEPTERGQP